MELIRQFNNMVELFSRRLRMFPAETDVLIWDKRFIPEFLIDHLKSQADGEDDKMWRDGDHCYQYLMDEMNSFIESERIFHLCESEDIKENYLAGEYSYYFGTIDDNLSFLYHQSVHMFHYPNQITLYGNQYTASIFSDNIEIEIYETVDEYRKLFFLPERSDIVIGLTNMLMRYDRRLDTRY